MATRTALLNGNVINRDTDFSKHIEAVSEPGVISGLTVTSSSVAVGQALVKCERTNGDTIYAVVYNNSAQSISGDGDVYIEIPQELIDNGELANEDGSEIAEIKVGTMPAKNALKLATKSGNTITDARNMIKKVGELKALIDTNTANISSLDIRVGNLEEAGAIDHLEESGLVGELYTLNDTLFKQYTPTLANSTLDCNVGDVTANQYIHIQRIGSGTGSNQIKLKVKKVGSPTTNLIVEVKKGITVTVTADSEAYWYGGGDTVASGSIAYGNISTSYDEKTITLNANFGGTKGELLDVVVSQTSGTVNDSNYYVIACDNTQYSEALSYVAVTGNTRVRSRLIPYCVSNGLSDTAIVKKGINADLGIQSTITNETMTTLYTATKSGKYKFKCSITNTSASGTHYMQLWINSYSQDPFVEWYNGENTTKDFEITFDMKVGDVLYGRSSHGSYGSGSTKNIKLYSEKSPANSVALKPIEVESLGEMGYGTSYGLHPNDNVFYGGIMLGTETSATTGSITLGNAVGYITVNLNGSIVKIPYYNE